MLEGYQKNLVSDLQYSTSWMKRIWMVYKPNTKKIETVGKCLRLIQGHCDRLVDDAKVMRMIFESHLQKLQKAVQNTSLAYLVQEPSLLSNGTGDDGEDDGNGVDGDVHGNGDGDGTDAHTDAADADGMAV